MRTHSITIAAVAVRVAALAACGSKPASSSSGRAPRPAAAPPARSSTPAWCSTPVASTTTRSTSRRGPGCRPPTRRTRTSRSATCRRTRRTTTRPTSTPRPARAATPIIAVGGLMADAVTKAAARRTRASTTPRSTRRRSGPNVYGLQYNTAQGGFLGGYLAAGMTKTGKVATYGGLNIPPVTIYMDGFWEGVQYYNSQNKQERPGARLGREEPEGRHLRQTRSPTRTRASRSRRQFIAAGRRHRSSRSPVAPASARPRRPRRPAARSSHLGRHRRLRERAAVLPVLPDQVTKGLTGSVDEYATAGRRRAPSRPATTSARWRTTAPACAVPRLRQQGPGGR